MNEDKVTVKQDNGEKKQLCKVRVSTTPERGFEVYLQSNQSFNLFAHKSKEMFKLGGVDCYVPQGGDGHTLGGVPGQFRTSGNIFQVDNYLNLSMLLAKDIKSGITFNFGLFPVSDDKINEYAANFKTQIKTMFLTYLKPYSVSMVISTATVEDAQHD